MSAAEHSGARTCQRVHLHLQTFGYESGIKHLSVVTAAALPERDVNVSRDAEGGREEGRPVGKWNQIGRDRRKDDQINHMGHFFSVQKGLIYTPTLGSHDREANFSVVGRQDLYPDAGRGKKWREMTPDVSYCWSRVCAITQQGGTNQHLAVVTCIV